MITYSREETCFYVNLALKDLELARSSLRKSAEHLMIFGYSTELSEFIFAIERTLNNVPDDRHLAKISSIKKFLPIVDESGNIILD